MTAIVSVETVLLVLLVVLVAGLLRSHAEILRRLGPDGSAARPRPAPRVAPPPRSAARETAAAPALAGVTPAGDAIELCVRGPGPGADAACVPDQRLHELRGVLGDARRARGCRGRADRDRHPRRRARAPAKLRSLAPEGVAGGDVLSRRGRTTRSPARRTSCWSTAGGPRRGRGDHLAGAGLARRRRDRGAARGRRPGARAAGRIDETLAERGSGPDHPSLYPDRRLGRDRDWWCSAAARRSSPRSRVGLVALRRVDAREHHPARRAGPQREWAMTVYGVPARRHRRRRGARRRARLRSAAIVARPASNARSALLCCVGARRGDRARPASRGPSRARAGRSTSAGSTSTAGWVYGLGYGAQLGLGVTHRGLERRHLRGDARRVPVARARAPAALIIGCFGAVRGLTLLAGAGVRTPAAAARAPPPAARGGAGARVWARRGACWRRVLVALALAAGAT